MKTIQLFLLLCSPLLGLGQQKLTSVDESQIKEVFFKTETSWNNTDIDGFMEGYWKSDRLTFVGSKGLTHGYNATKEKYIKGYPDKAAMGQLKFTILKLSKIDTNSALMIGQFYLTRTIGDLHGHFTLVWKRIDGKWVIISDHSSADE